MRKAGPVIATVAPDEDGQVYNVNADTVAGAVAGSLNAKRMLLLTDVPEGYLTVGSALGRDKPRHLVIAPARVDGSVNGVIELGFLHPPGPLVLALLEDAAESIGVALRSAPDPRRSQAQTSVAAAVARPAV